METERFGELPVKMARGVRFGFRWQCLLSAMLALVCLSCQPALQTSRPPAAPLPPPAPESPPQHQTVYVKVGRLNLRAGPGMDFPKIGFIERNEELEKLGEAEDWVQVRVKRDRTLGWVASEFLSSAPVAAPLETTSPAPTTSPPPGSPPPKEPPPADLKRPKPTNVETVVPRAHKPAEAAEPPPPPKPKPSPEPAPAPSPEPKTVPAKPAPKIEEPPAPPAPEPPEEKPSRIRIM